MAANMVVRAAVEWRNSHSFFYGRLWWSVVEDSLVKTVKDAAGDMLTCKSAIDMIKKWFLESEFPRQEEAWDDDEACFSWKNNFRNHEVKLQELHLQKVLLQLSKLGDCSLDLQALPQALRALLKKVEPSTGDKLVSELQGVLNLSTNS